MVCMSYATLYRRTICFKAMTIITSNICAGMMEWVSELVINGWMNEWISDWVYKSTYFNEKIYIVRLTIIIVNRYCAIFIITISNTIISIRLTNISPDVSIEIEPNVSMWNITRVRGCMTSSINTMEVNSPSVLAEEKGLVYHRCIVCCHTSSSIGNTAVHEGHCE